MREFRHKDEKLVIVVQVIHYSLCNYMYSKSGSITFAHGACTLPMRLISEIILEPIMVSQTVVRTPLLVHQPLFAGMQH